MRCRERFVENSTLHQHVQPRGFASFATKGFPVGAFVISKKLNGDFKFIYASRKGKTVFTSIGCKQKDDCDRIIAALRTELDVFAVTKVKAPGGKFFFRISREGLVLANSRKFTTELLLQKGIDEIFKYLPTSETLDFSEENLAFPPAESIFQD